ncbi:hypothetical protein [Mucilaginibacter ginkgonis]|uniref:Uncharacterized protein n=1 Tax=Mucilaginibacter ginkgonis TaxID=2682091 RepID=A0A6I4HV54_9SPHI|nr:hypothetical protein [Mucilaginibacter ginkgonis]QQL49997.1 hypothetical protein GO620_000675 [Mucilaginibacter ginkgonis]
MSILAEKTERKAIKVLANTLRYFDDLNFLNMTAEDDFDAATAKRLISGLVEKNGYEVHFRQGKGTKITKQPLSW